MEQKIIKSSNHYNNIDGLRTFAAIGIIMMHVSANLGFGTGNFAIDAIIALFSDFVFLFMIISGFSMCCGYYDKISKGTISLNDFYQKRYSKIWPYFAVLVLLDVIISPSKEALFEAFANLTLIFGLLPNADISVIGVGWTLGVIFLFYLLFPFFVFLLKDKITAWISMGVCVVYHIVCSSYFLNTDHVLKSFNDRTNFIFCSMFFMAGGIIYLYKDKLQHYVQKYYLFAVFLNVIFTILFIGAKISGLLKSKIIYNLLLLVVFSMWIICSIGKETTLLSNKITQFLSSISMEIYLCHMVVFRGLEKLKVFQLFNTSWIAYIIITVITIVAAVIFAFLVKNMLKFGSDKIKNKVRSS